MSKSKHSPGPWTVEVVDFGVGQNVVDIRTIETGDETWDEATARTQANARLIAAAPELLEALATISELLLDRNMGVGSMDDETFCETIGDIVTVAMGKAIGGSNE